MQERCRTVKTTPAGVRKYVAMSNRWGAFRHSCSEHEMITGIPPPAFDLALMH